MEKIVWDNEHENGKMPVLFIGHGSPMNIIQKSSFTDALTKLGKRLPRPRVILVISAHWLTNGTWVTCMEKPRTIYDFYGFPDELYKKKYPSPGSPSTARFIIESVKSLEVKCDYEWGLDHASWAVLSHMYPDADVPVIEMSLDYSPYNEWLPKSLQYHYKLASELAPLRKKGILIIGSGNIVHNLGLIDFNPDAEPFEWAVSFDEKVKNNLIQRNHEALLNYRKMGKSAPLSVPTLDHYLPMIYAIGLQGKEETLKFVHEGIQHGSVSMRAFQIG